MRAMPAVWQASTTRATAAKSEPASARIWTSGCGDLGQALLQQRGSGQLDVEPVAGASSIYRHDDRLGKQLAQLVALSRQLHGHSRVNHRNGDQEDDQQDQHHVHQGRGVDLGQHLVVAVRPVQAVTRGVETDGHSYAADRLATRRLFSISIRKSVCRSEPKPLTLCSATRLRRTSQL